jgi:hypothetical protein
MNGVETVNEANTAVRMQAAVIIIMNNGGGGRGNLWRRRINIPRLPTRSGLGEAAFRSNH